MPKTALFLLFFFSLRCVYSQQCQNDSTGLVPIMDLGLNSFNGMQGGLYGQGQNAMPQAHLYEGIQMASQILPLNAQGNYAVNGKIGFISMGMSNANIFFAGLRDSAVAYPHLNTRLTMVNGATGGFDIDLMLDTNSQYWVTLDQKLASAGITKNQVQVIWFMQAKHISGIPPNQGIEHIEIMETKFLQAFHYFKKRFPNLKQIYCSGRDYGGYNNPGSGNPEPYAYYTGWSFRKLVERQINGDTLLAYSGPNPKTAWLAWANYVWADGKNIRSDGFNWLCPDDVQSDGVHPNAHGKAKVASLLFDFFKTDTTAYWFRENSFTSHDGFAGQADNPIVINVYPNPTSEFLYIETYGKKYEKFEILNALGEIIEATSESPLNVSNYPKGVYLLKVIFNDKIMIKKFIIP